MKEKIYHNNFIIVYNVHKVAAANRKYKIILFFSEPSYSLQFLPQTRSLIFVLFWDKERYQAFFFYLYRILIEKIMTRSLLGPWLGKTIISSFKK